MKERARESGRQGVSEWEIQRWNLTKRQSKNTKKRSKMCKRRKRKRKRKRTRTRKRKRKRKRK